MSALASCGHKTPKRSIEAALAEMCSAQRRAGRIQTGRAFCCRLSGVVDATAANAACRVARHFLNEPRRGFAALPRQRRRWPKLE